MKSEFIMVHKNFFRNKNEFFSMSFWNFIIRTFCALKMVINDILKSTTLGFMNIIFIITTLFNMITFVSYKFFFIFTLDAFKLYTNTIHLRLNLEDITLNLEFLFLFIERNSLILKLMHAENLKCNKCD